jgi:serine/threonine protein kinase
VNEDNPESESVDDLFILRLREEVISRIEHGEHFTLEDAVARCRNDGEREELVLQLLPDEILAYRKLYGRDPVCEELAQEHDSLRDEIFAVYERLPAEFRYPFRIGRYRVVSALSNSSAQAMVVKARDDGAGADVAIKYPKRSTDGPRLHNEARILETLRDGDGPPHPHIIALRAVESSPGGPFLVLDFLPGTTVYRSPPMTLNQAVSVAADIADALAYVHSKGICHNDISPNNVLVTNGGRAVLIDFALAVDRQYGSNDHLAPPEFGGTEEFYPPERVQGTMRDGASGDQYAVATLLKWILIKRRIGVSPKLASSENSWSCPDDLPPRLQRIIERGSKGRPEERYPSTSEFRDALRDYLRSHQKRKQRLIAGAGIGLGTLAVVVLAYVFSIVIPGRTDDPPPHSLLQGSASEVSQSTLRNALAIGDAESLVALSKGDLALPALERALAAPSQSGERTIAFEFLSRSRSAEEAMEWLAKQLAGGLDPNLVVTDGNGDEITLLSLALESRNALAVEVLLEAGASPHPYRTFAGKYGEPISFLFPYIALERYNFSAAEQQRLASSLLAHGAIVPEPLHENWRNLPKELLIEPHSAAEAAAASVVRLGPKYGLDIRVEPTLYDLPASAIADAATRRGPHDWNAFLIKMPKIFKPEFEGCRPYYIEVRHVLAILDDRIFLIGACRCGVRGMSHAVFETTYEGESWRLFVYHGLGGVARNAVQPEPVPGDAYPENAYERWYWRAMDMRYDPTTQKMSNQSVSYLATLDPRESDQELDTSSE